MGKFKILVETVTFGYDDPLPARQHTYGTGVSHQLIEFDVRAEADYAFQQINIAGMGGLYMRAVWKLYP